MTTSVAREEEEKKGGEEGEGEEAEEAEEENEGEEWAAVEPEADGEAAKYGNDIVFMAEFANSRGQFMSWITVSSSTQGTLPTLRGFEAGFDSLAAL